MKSLNITFILAAIIAYACENRSHVERISEPSITNLVRIGKDIGREMVFVSNGLNSRIESVDTLDTLYSAAYDSLFISMFGLKTGLKYPYDSDYTDNYMYLNWSGCRPLLDSVAINRTNPHDTLYFSAYSSFNDGILYEFTILGNTTKNYMIDWVRGTYIQDLYKFSPCVELSPLAVKLLGLKRRWDPDSLRKVSREVSLGLHDEAGNIKIHGAYPMHVTAARIIIGGKNTLIDTVSYATWMSPAPFIKIMRKKLNDCKPTPYINIYNEVFDRLQTSCNHNNWRIELDKSDFLLIWKMLDIQPQDTVYLSLFIPLDKDSDNQHTALFQSGARSIWATNPMPESYSKNDRSDATVYDDSPVWFQGGNQTLIPNKHRGEAWDTTYRSLYQSLRILTPRQELARPDIWDSGDTRPYKVMNAKVEITADGYSIDTMGYTANLRIPTLIDNNYR